MQKDWYNISQSHISCNRVSLYVKVNLVSFYNKLSVTWCIKPERRWMMFKPNGIAKKHALPIEITKLFLKFKVALNPTYILCFLNCAKNYVLSCLLSFDSVKKITMPFLNYKPPKLSLWVLLAPDIVAMVIYCVTKIITTSSPMVGQFLNTMIVASIDNEWLQRPIKK